MKGDRALSIRRLCSVLKTKGKNETALVAYSDSSWRAMFYNKDDLSTTRGGRENMEHDVMICERGDFKVSNINIGIMFTD